MNQTMLTVQGWIGTVPMLREVAGVPVLTFRLGCTPRHFNRSTGTWVDSETQWYAVSAWRRLASNAEPSLRQGDPVVVHGRLVADVWERDGKPQTSFEVVASAVGHDLSQGTTVLTRSQVSAVESCGEAQAEADRRSPAASRAVVSFFMIPSVVD